MELHEFVSQLLVFPTNIFAIPLGLFFLIMLIDLLFNVVETLTADIDLFDLDNIPGQGILLPPVLSKVPLTIALFVSFFAATVLSFYFQQFMQDVEALLFEHVSLSIFVDFGIVCDVISIPIIAYLALIIAAWVLKPITPLFSNRRFAEVDFIGLKGRVHSNNITNDYGEVVILHDGNEFLIDAKMESNLSAQYGDEVIIVAKDNASNRYVVALSN